jgi:hypothetical protein
MPKLMLSSIQREALSIVERRLCVHQDYVTFDHCLRILLVFFHVAPHRSLDSPDCRVLHGAERHTGISGDEEGGGPRRFDGALVGISPRSGLWNVCFERGRVLYSECRSNSLFLR